MTAVALEIRGLAEAIAQVRGVEDRMQRLEPAMRVVAALITRHIDDRFATSTDPSGSPWAPLADSTLRSRRGSTATILVDTARLRNSNHAEPTNDSVLFGTNVAYGTFHQAPGEDSPIPERRFLPVVEIGGEWVLDASGPAGELWERAARVIEQYVLDGRITG